MASNFDLSLPDDDAWLETLETEDDYKDRDEFERSMTPPSPSLLSIEEDNDDEVEEVLPPPAKRRSVSRNPFLDDDDATPKKSSNSLIPQLAKFNLANLSLSEIAEVQSLIIAQLKVITYSESCLLKKDALCLVYIFSENDFNSLAQRD